MANVCNSPCGPGTPLIVPTSFPCFSSCDEFDGQGTVLNVPRDGIVVTNKKVDAPRVSRGGNAELALAFSELVVTPKTISTRFDASLIASRGGFAEGGNPSGPMAPKFPFKRCLHFCDGYNIFEKIPLEAFCRVCERQNKEFFDHVASDRFPGRPSSETESEGEWVGTRVRSKVKLIDPLVAQPNVKQKKRRNQWKKKALPGANARPRKGKVGAWHRDDYEAYPWSTASVSAVDDASSGSDSTLDSEIYRRRCEEAGWPFLEKSSSWSVHSLLDEEYAEDLAETAQSLEEMCGDAMPSLRAKAKPLIVLVLKTFTFIRCVRRFEKEQRTLAAYAETLVGYFTQEILDAFGSLARFFRTVRSAFVDGNKPVSTSFVSDLLGNTSLLLRNPNVVRLLRILGVIIAAGVARFVKIDLRFDRLNHLWEAFLGDSSSKFDAVELIIEFIRWLAALFTNRGAWMQTLFCGLDSELINHVSEAAKVLASNGHARMDEQGVRDLMLLKKDVDRLVEYFKRAMADSKASHYSRMYLRPLMEYSSRLQNMIKSSKPREQAWSIFLSGPAGQGKSALSYLIVKGIDGHANICGTAGMSPEEAHAKQLADTFPFNCAGAKYLSGYNGQPIMIFEDMGNAKNAGKSEFSPTDFLIGAVNNNVIMTPQADVESKGCIPYAAKVVIINSNTDDVGAHQLSNSPWSIGRRLGLKVTPKLRGESNGVVDVDLWEFDIYKGEPVVHAENTQRTTETFTWRHLETCGYARFMQIILADYDAHVERQKKFMESVNRVGRFCPKGQLLSVCPQICKCDEPLETGFVSAESSVVLMQEHFSSQELRPGTASAQAEELSVDRGTELPSASSPQDAPEQAASTALSGVRKAFRDTGFSDYKDDTDWDSFDTLRAGGDKWATWCAGFYKLLWTSGMLGVYVVPALQFMAPVCFGFFVAWLSMTSFCIYLLARLRRRQKFWLAYAEAGLEAAATVDKVTTSVHRRLAETLIPKTLGTKVTRGVAVVSALTALLAGWRLFRKTESTSFWSKAPKGRVEQTPAASGLQMNVMEKYLRAAVRLLKCNDGKYVNDAWGFMVRSSAMIAPKHALKLGASLRVSYEEDGMTVVHNVTLDKETVHDLGGDLVLVVANALGTAKNLLAYIPSGLAVGVQKFGVLVGGDELVHTLTTQGIVRTVPTDQARFEGVRFVTDGSWAPRHGTSGSVVYDLERYVPIGFSLAAVSDGAGYFQPVTQATVEKIKNICVAQFNGNEGDPVTLPEELEEKIISTRGVHRMSHARFVPHTCHVPVAHCSRRTRAVSNVIVSEMAPYFVGSRALTEMGPPNFAGGWQDYEKERTQMVRGPAFFSRGDLREAMEVRTSELVATNPVVRGPLNLEEVINGVENDPHIDGMDLTTSSGWPHFGKKSSFVVYNAVDGVSDARPSGLRADQLAAYSELVEKLESGHKILVLFNATKKDEVLKVTKAPRTFYAASMMVIMLVRKYFAPVLSALKHNPLEAEIAIGMNCYAEDWTAIWEHLARQGTTKIIAGDYGSFDMTHSADALRMGYQLMVNMAQESGMYSETDILAMTTLAESLCEAFMSFDGTWFRLVGWLMSGIPITAELNSILNQMYFRIAWKHTTKRPMQEFRNFVATTTYGDDHVLSVSERETTLHSLFNFAEVKKCLESFGMIYTNTDKTDAVHEYERLEEVEYLKRRFVPRASKVYAPLRVSSLDKRIVWTASRAPDRVVSVLNSLAIDCYEHGEAGLAYWTDVVNKLRGASIVGATGFQPGDPDYLAGEPIESMLRLVTESQIPYPSFWKDHPRGNQGYIDDRDWLALFCSKRKPEENSQGENVDVPAQESKVEESCYSTSGVFTLAQDHYLRLSNRVEDGIQQLTQTNNNETICKTMKIYEEPGVPALLVPGASNGTERRAGEPDSSLAAYLSRPVKVMSFQWVPGSPLNTQALIPWRNLLANSLVASIVERYALLRATLRLKFLVNGNGFYYGRLVARYQPRERCYNSANALALIDKLRAYDSPPTSAQWVMLKQMPHVVIDPTTTVGAEMTVPMLLPDDWLDLTEVNAQGYSNLAAGLGTLFIEDFNSLQHANGATDPLTITVLAWMENVELNFPRSTSAVTPVDEYKEAADKPLSISGVLTTVADVASVVESVPVLQPFAKATNLIATLGASIAKMLGFSRPPVLDTPMPMVPRYLGSLANCDVPENVHKLTLNGRQEVCVDSSPFGYSSAEDEMALSTLVRKEGYFATFRWSPSNATETALFGMAVAPNYFATAPNGGIYTTPLCYFTLPFQYWRGSIVYHFEVVASSFHRGKLRVVWEPKYNLIGAPYNENFSVVLDISNQRDFYITVPYCSAEPYLDLSNAGVENGIIYGTLPILQAEAANGTLTVFVLNELSVMNTDGDNSIYVNVYAKAGHDFKVAKPSAKHLRDLAFVAPVVSTSRLYPADGVQDQVVTHGSNAPLTSDVPASKVDDVVFGESVVSFRQLLKRYNLSTCTYGKLSTSTNNDGWVVSQTCSSFPPFRGSMESARHGGYNYARTTLLNFLTPCYLGYRGSIRHKFITTRGANGLTNLFASLTESGRTGGPGASSTATFPMSTETQAISSFMANAGVAIEAMSGSACVPVGQNPVLEVEFPHYSNAKYFVVNSVETEVARDSTHANIIPAPPMYQLTEVGICRVPEDTANSVSGAAIRSASSLIWDYVSVGEDFSLHFFLSTPTLYAYPDPSPT